MFHYNGLRFKVAPGVYPPSDDSLLLAETVQASGRVLEIGTGTGIIAINLARKGHDVVATDINPHALECARENAAMNGVGDRVDVVRADLLNGIRGPFDTVVFNPPYLPSRPLGELRGIGELGLPGTPGGQRGAVGSLAERTPHGQVEEEGEEERRRRVEEGKGKEEKTEEGSEGLEMVGDGEKDPEDWLSRSWQGGKEGAEVLERFAGELGRHLSAGGRGYIVVSSLTDLRIPPESGLGVRVVAERTFDFERLYVLEVFKR